MPRFDVAAFRNWLLGIYDAQPGVLSAHAVAEIVRSVGHEALTIRNAVTPDDVFMQRALQQWDADISGVTQRFGWYRAPLEQGRGAAVADGLLHGRWPATLPESARHGLRSHLSPQGLQVEGQADAYTVASLFNQALEVAGEDSYLGAQPAAQALRGALSKTLAQLEQAAPGEDPTVRDNVVQGLKDAHEAVVDGAHDALEAAGDAVVKTLLVGAGAFGVGLGLWWAYKRASA